MFAGDLKVGDVFRPVDGFVHPWYTVIEVHEDYIRAENQILKTNCILGINDKVEIQTIFDKKEFGEHLQKLFHKGKNQALQSGQSQEKQ